MSLRIDRVNQEIKKKLMEIIQEEIDDPSLSVMSIVRVETARDLGVARVFYSIFADKKAKAHAQETLKKMSGFIRHELGGKIRLKFLPRLEFIPDDTIEYSVYIHKKIEEVTGDTETT